MKDKEKKEALRNQLFAKYFEEEGILVTDFLDKLSFIASAWQDLRELCAKNMKYFFQGKSLEKIKIVQNQDKKYLILKVRMWTYIIIDLEKREFITEQEFKMNFTEDFFVEHFDEIKADNEKIFSKLYRLENYEGDAIELIDLYNKNESLFCLTTKLDYSLEIGEAWTYFFIDFGNSRAQLGFQTLDQFLYEQLYLHYDLTPSVMQDATQRIGKERMQEIPKIKIPENLIPEDLLQAYRNQKENLKRDLIIKKD
ncbi:MAG: hypothetical protein HFJ02_04320 [Bacilli bacterium]|nr:hypothetical protein [Bacilli bacterium]